MFWTSSTSSFSFRFSSKYLRRACSVGLAPTMTGFGPVVSMAALVLLRKEKIISLRRPSGISSSLEWCLPVPSRVSATCNKPCVRVPVLSENKTVRLPAVSIPSNFLTRTLAFNSLRMFIERTVAIIIGSPSGTTTTMMMIANTIAVTISWTISPNGCEK